MATAIMKQKEVSEMDNVEEIISKISEDSLYKRRPTQKRIWMTVPEMGKLLGLKKTDRYWLVHKNVFESKEIAGKIRINIASFEKWYANQIKYHKVTGEEPGKELKSWSYSVKEVADLLGVDDYLVYDCHTGSRYRSKKYISQRTDSLISHTMTKIIINIFKGIYIHHDSI
mgnify:CR=1 FL=1